MSFFPKASDPPPSLLEFSRHFFQRVLLQVFNTENIIILELVMGKVIPTLHTAHWFKVSKRTLLVFYAGTSIYIKVHC